MSGLNGATGTVVGMIGTASAIISTIGGILFAQVYKAQDVLEKRLIEYKVDVEHELEKLQRETKDARKELRDDMMVRFARVDDIFLERGKMIESANASIQVLDTKLVEVETQFRAVATVNNLDRSAQDAINDLLQQCATCRKPPRVYYPPGPGLSGANGQH